MTTTDEGSGAARSSQVIGPVVDVEFPPGELPEIYTRSRSRTPPSTRAGQPRHRGRAAPRREHRALHRDGLDRRPGPRHGSKNTGAPSRCRSARRCSAASSTSSASRSTSAGPSTPSAMPHPPPGPQFVDQNVKIEIFETGIKVIDLLAPTAAAARSASSAAPASARPCSSWSSSTTSPRSEAASRCSPASASAPARATTSTTR